MACKNSNSNSKWTWNTYSSKLATVRIRALLCDKCYSNTAILCQQWQTATDLRCLSALALRQHVDSHTNPHHFVFEDFRLFHVHKFECHSRGLILLRHYTRFWVSRTSRNLSAIAGLILLQNQKLGSGTISGPLTKAPARLVKGASQICFSSRNLF